MTKELYVSSTPHETKVGLVEDEQLAEIYLERENEYTLAGSIYKGRVTRVLPGMQSAFVDIGLERDAFLYVSDFMELEDQDELDELPVHNPVIIEPGRELEQHAEPAAVPMAAPQNDDAGSHRTEHAVSQPAEPRDSSRSAEPREGGRGWRGRRRGRRGERNVPERENRAARPNVEPPRESHRSEPVDEYGPPPGYQPIILPGESISKYQRLAQAQHPEPAKVESFTGTGEEEPEQLIAEVFPADEPLFAAPTAEPNELVEEEPASSFHPAPSAEIGDAPSPWDDEQQRLHQMNVAAIFGGDAAEPTEATEEETDEVEEEAESDICLTAAPEHSDPKPYHASAGTMEEEEIDEDEADLSSYVEELEEDAAFDEVEEETHAAEEFHAPADAHEIAASGEAVAESAAPFSAEPISPEESEVAGAEEGVEEEAEEEDELEEAQAQAEALLDAEARADGTVDAHAEVRAPSPTAAYTQRAQRPGYGRRGGQRGRRGGGRPFRRREPQNVPQISELLKEGQEILVQIAKEPIGKKGARITSHIALPGRFLVYMPTVNHAGVSRKIASEEERQRLKRIITSERENGHGGFIVRTAAQGASEEELRADIRFLKGLWTEIKGRAEAGKGPTLIYHDLNVVERVLRDQVTSDFSVIWVDNEQEYERILRFANRFQPALVRRVKLYSKETSLFDQFGLNEEINKALKSKVWLKSGGYIVINQTEALVAIDVNTGKYVGKTARLEDTIVKTNVDAIKEIVRQIRLRDLGGIIIIDFIDMDERRNRQKVMQALEEALRSDRSPSKVLQFNDFGLVAITRKRVKQSLERTIGAPCPYCQSTGYVKSVTTVCNEIYIEMRKISKHLEHSDVMLRVNPEVAKALKTDNARLLMEMEDMTKHTVIIKSDPALHQEQFDIN